MTKKTPAFLALALACAACASPVPVQRQEYAQLRDTRTFEYDLPAVWRGIEKSLKDHRIVKRDPAEVSEIEFRKLAERSLETEWAYGQSRDKYVEFEANGSPRKKYLATRFRYRVNARKTLAGTDVRVGFDEEIERLKPNGDSAGWTRADAVDSSRPNELLERIQLAILSAAP